MGQTKKTHNTYLADKVALRAGHLPKRREIYVLDCFAGKGLIWEAVKEVTGRKITTLPIDMDIKSGFRLPGNNMGYLDSIDLSPFDVIDLDAYGVPYPQLRVILERGFKGAVFVTFIQSIYSQMPQGLLRDIGFGNGMIEKIPTLFAQRGWEYFLGWLALKGIRKIWSRSHSRKHYLFFNL
jgi:hypothetical protein